MPRQDLRTFFDELPDPRVGRTRKHMLVDIVLLVLIATIMGIEGWDDIHVFGVSRLKQPKAVLDLANGIPSAIMRSAVASLRNLVNVIY